MPDSATIASWVAFAVAVVALAVALAQLLQQYIGTAQKKRLCDKLVWGPMPGKTGQLIWVWRQFRFRVVYQVPNIFIEPTKWDTHGYRGDVLDSQTVSLPHPFDKTSLKPTIKDHSRRGLDVLDTERCAEACWVSFTRKVCQVCPKDIRAWLTVGDADRLPDDISVVPMKISTRDTIAMGLMIGLRLLTFNDEKLEMGGPAGFLASSRHPILGDLLHFTPYPERLETSESELLHGDLARSWLLRLKGTATVAGNEYTFSQVMHHSSPGVEWLDVDDTTRRQSQARWAEFATFVLQLSQAQTPFEQQDILTASQKFPLGQDRSSKDLAQAHGSTTMPWAKEGEEVELMDMGSNVETSDPQTRESQVDVNFDPANKNDAINDERQRCRSMDQPQATMPLRDLVQDAPMRLEAFVLPFAWACQIDVQSGLVATPWLQAPEESEWIATLEHVCFAGVFSALGSDRSSLPELGNAGCDLLKFEDRSKNETLQELQNHLQIGRHTWPPYAWHSHQRKPDIKLSANSRSHFPMFGTNNLEKSTMLPPLLCIPSPNRNSALYPHAANGTRRSPPIAAADRLVELASLDFWLSAASEMPEITEGLLDATPRILAEVQWGYGRHVVKLHQTSILFHIDIRDIRKLAAAIEEELISTYTDSTAGKLFMWVALLRAALFLASVRDGPSTILAYKARAFDNDFLVHMV